MLHSVAPTSGKVSATAFRAGIGAFALLLGLIGIWLVAVEIVRPRSMGFPTDAKTSQAWAAERPAATLAASIGYTRGDLWAAAAISRAAPFFFQSGAGTASPAELEEAAATAAHAARLSPHDARVWLSIAALEALAEPGGRKAAEALKLSYYAGPYEPSLVPLRLTLALRTEAGSDQELQELVGLEIQRIVMKEPALKPAVMSAYRNAPSRGRALVVSTLQQVDPGFLATLRAQAK